jgi:hypothetical protein
MTTRHNEMQTRIVEAIMKSRSLKQEETLKNKTIDVRKFRKQKQIDIQSEGNQREIFNFGQTSQEKEILSKVRNFSE